MSIISIFVAKIPVFLRIFSLKIGVRQVVFALKMGVTDNGISKTGK